MSSSVVGTIELADHPVEALAPSCSLPERIRHAYRVGAPDADFAVVTEEILDADIDLIRRQLRNELSQIMRAVDVLGGRA